jgi:hypothetical protein
MSGYDKYRRMCGRKKAYATEELAMSAGNKWHQRPYECPCCGKWHLTSKLKTTKGENHE